MTVESSKTVMGIASLRNVKACSNEIKLRATRELGRTILCRPLLVVNGPRFQDLMLAMATMIVGCVNTWHEYNIGDVDLCVLLSKKGHRLLTFPYRDIDNCVFDE